MLISRHIVVSLSVGAALWFFTKSLYAGLISFISGIIPDVDHIIEYIIQFGIRGFSISKVSLACEHTTRQQGNYRFRRLYLIFHMGEFAILLIILSLYTGNIYLTAAALGYNTHLIMDCVGNPMYPYSYFIVWRAVKGFDPDRLFKKGALKGPASPTP